MQNRNKPTSSCEIDFQAPVLPNTPTNLSSSLVFQYRISDESSSSDPGLTPIVEEPQALKKQSFYAFREKQTRKLE